MEFKKWIFGTILEVSFPLFIPFFLSLFRGCNRTMQLIFSLSSSIMLPEVSIFRYLYNYQGLLIIK